MGANVKVLLFVQVFMGSATLKFFFSFLKFKLNNTRVKNSAAKHRETVAHAAGQAL